MFRTSFICALLLSAISFVHTSAAQAPQNPAPPAANTTESLDVEVVVAHGRTAPGVRAESLRDFPALFRAPFATYATLSELSRNTNQLSATTPLILTLPNGRRLQIVLSGRDQDGKYRLRVSINRPEGTNYLPLLQVRAAAGEPFFVAGQEYQEGTLIVCIRVRPRAS